MNEYTFEQENFAGVLQFMLEKLRKIIYGKIWPFWGEGGCLVTKINTNFFVWYESLNIFSLNNFLKKRKPKQKTIFSKITSKYNFRGLIVFQGMGCWMTKRNKTFSMGNRVPNMALKFFPQKPLTDWMKNNKPVLGIHFPPYR